MAWAESGFKSAITGTDFGSSSDWTTKSVTLGYEPKIMSASSCAGGDA